MVRTRTLETCRPFVALGSLETVRPMLAVRDPGNLALSLSELAPFRRDTASNGLN